MKTLYELYKEMKTDEDQKKLSLTALSGKLDCMPWQVRDTYVKQLIDDKFTRSELEQLINDMNSKKFKEAAAFEIRIDNTSSALLEQWTIEYKNEIFKD